MIIKNHKTHCSHGHEFTPENTYTKPDGYRQCRACRACRLFHIKVFKIRLIGYLIRKKVA